jgi:hypothetical protein
LTSLSWMSFLPITRALGRPVGGAELEGFRRGRPKGRRRHQRARGCTGRIRYAVASYSLSDASVWSPPFERSLRGPIKAHAALEAKEGLKRTRDSIEEVALLRALGGQFMS